LSQPLPFRLALHFEPTMQFAKVLIGSQPSFFHSHELPEFLRASAPKTMQVFRSLPFLNTGV
jgi:hypothetical protein